MLGELAEYVIGFEQVKHVPMNQLSVFLGAEDDMRYIPVRGEMYIGVTDKRRFKLLVLLRQYIDVRIGELVRLTHAHAAKLFEKAGSYCVQSLAGSELRRCKVYNSKVKLWMCTQDQRYTTPRSFYIGR